MNYLWPLVVDRLKGDLTLGEEIVRIGKFRRAAAVVALTVAALFAAPTMAQAVGDTYPPNDSYISVQPPATVAPSETLNLSFVAGSFGPGQTVSFTLTGEGATGATLAVLHAAVDTLGTNKAAASDGSLSTALTLPATAAGSYNLTAAVPGWARTWTFTLVGADGDSRLVTTGTEPNQLLWVWIAGGALALIGGAIVVGGSARRRRKLAA